MNTELYVNNSSKGITLSELSSTIIEACQHIDAICVIIKNYNETCVVEDNGFFLVLISSLEDISRRMTELIPNHKD